MSHDGFKLTDFDYRIVEENVSTHEQNSKCFSINGQRRTKITGFAGRNYIVIKKNDALKRFV